MATQRKILTLDTVTPQGMVPQTGVDAYLAPVTLDALGADSVTNGTFASDTGWVKGTGWTIAAGVASCDGTQVADSDLENTGNAPVAASKYEVVFTVSNYSAGNVTPVVGAQEGTDRSANGTYTEIITASDTSVLKIRADLDFVGDIDNVTMKLITDEVAFDIQCTTNKGGSGGDDTALRVNQVDTASPGTSLLADFQTGSVSKASIDNTGVVAGLTFEPTGDTAAGDAAALGYTAAEGAILTGQGSTSDVTVKNDADAEVISIPTGTTTLKVASDIVMVERADHESTPGAGFGYLWVKSDTPSSLYFTDDAGTDTDLTAASGAFSADANGLISATSAPVLDEATGNEVAYTLNYTVNKASSGNDTGLLINMTDTASPGTSLLADFQVGGSPVAAVGATGYLHSYGNFARVDLNNATAVVGLNAGLMIYSAVTNQTAIRLVQGAHSSQSVIHAITHNTTDLTASSGSQSFLKVDPRINQSSTAGYTGILLDVTETATGSGAKNLLDLQVGSTSKMLVANSGKITFNATLGSDAVAIDSATRAGPGWGFRDGYPMAFGTSGAREMYVNNGVVIRSGKQFLFSSSSTDPYTAGDTGIERVAAKIIGLTDGSTGTAGLVGGGTYTASSGTEYAISFAPTVNQSGTAGYTGILLDVTETATGSGATNLLDLQVGSASKFKVGNDGGVTLASGVTFPATGNDIVFNAADQFIVGTAPFMQFGATQYFLFQHDDSTTNSVVYQFGRDTGAQLTAASGTQAFGAFYPDINQTSTAGYTGILLDVTETATGSGSKKLLDLQVGSTSKFSVDNAGKVVIDLAETQALSSGLEVGNSSGAGFASYGGTGVSFLAGGVSKFYFNENTLGSTIGGGAIDASASTATVPGLLPTGADTDTGIGAAAADAISLIAGGVEAVRLTEASSIITVDIDAGDNAAGNVGALTSIKSAIATVSSSAAATLTAASLIPAGCFLIGLTARITTTFGNSTGLTSFDIGDGSDVDRWGATIAITSGTTVDLTDATATASGSFAAANNVVLTANGGNFDGTGVIELIAHYIDLTAPTG